MMTRQVIPKKNRRLCIGQMRDHITISGRKILEPEFGDVDFLEQFKDGVVRWATVNTIKGKTVFAGIGVDVALSHEIYIRYDQCVTSESWIVLPDDTRLDVVMVEDLDERHEFMRLLCQDRGDKDRAASRA